MLRWWTIGRATGIGITAGLASLILWPLYAAYQERVFWLFLASLTVAAACGASILLITIVDALLKPRARSLRPIRAFDLALRPAARRAEPASDRGDALKARGSRLSNVRRPGSPCRQGP